MNVHLIYLGDFVTRQTSPQKGWTGTQHSVSVKMFVKVWCCGFVGHIPGEMGLHGLEPVFNHVEHCIISSTILKTSLSFSALLVNWFQIEMN